MTRAGVRRLRRGFSIVELLVVMTVLGILVRFGFPRFWEMRRQATARAVIGDVAAVRLAAFNYNTERNAWPPEYAMGVPPIELSTYLPAGFDFHRSEYTLDWEVWPAPGGVPGNATATSVIAVAVEAPDTLLSAAVRSAANVGIPYIVSGSKTTFLLAGFGGNY